MSIKRVGCGRFDGFVLLPMLAAMSCFMSFITPGLLCNSAFMSMPICSVSVDITSPSKEFISTFAKSPVVVMVEIQRIC